MHLKSLLSGSIGKWKHLSFSFCPLSLFQFRLIECLANVIGFSGAGAAALYRAVCLYDDRLRASSQKHKVEPEAR